MNEKELEEKLNKAEEFIQKNEARTQKMHDLCEKIREDIRLGNGDNVFPDIQNLVYAFRLRDIYVSTRKKGDL